eukprot:763686-Hanusia_phi.AAC.3
MSSFPRTVKILGGHIILHALCLTIASMLVADLILLSGSAMEVWGAASNSFEASQGWQSVPNKHYSTRTTTRCISTPRGQAFARTKSATRRTTRRYCTYASAKRRATATGPDHHGIAATSSEACQRTLPAARHDRVRPAER